MLERAEGPPDHLGAETRAAHAEQRAVGEALALDLVRPCLEVAGPFEHVLRAREPAETVRHLRSARRAPQRVVLAPYALGGVVGLRLADLLRDAGLEIVRDRGADRRRTTGDDRLAHLL